MPHEKTLYANCKSQYAFLKMSHRVDVNNCISLEMALCASRARNPDDARRIQHRISIDAVRREFKYACCKMPFVEERPDWPAIREVIMWNLLLSKFAVVQGSVETLLPMGELPRDLVLSEDMLNPNVQLRHKLLNTHPAYIEDVNYQCKNYWEICHCWRCKRQKGQNIHGKQLTLLRNALMAYYRAKG